MNTSDYENYKLDFSAFSNELITEAYAVVSVEHEGEKLFYESFQIECSNQWKSYAFEGVLDADLRPDSKLSIYVWNPSQKELLLDHLVVKLY